MQRSIISKYIVNLTVEAICFAFVFMWTIHVSAFPVGCSRVATSSKVFALHFSWSRDCSVYYVVSVAPPPSNPITQQQDTQPKQSSPNPKEIRLNPLTPQYEIAGIAWLHCIDSVAVLIERPTLTLLSSLTSDWSQQ